MAPPRPTRANPGQKHLNPRKTNATGSIPWENPENGPAGQPFSASDANGAKGTQTKPLKSCSSCLVLPAVPSGACDSLAPLASFALIGSNDLDAFAQRANRGGVDFSGGAGYGARVFGTGRSARRIRFVLCHGRARRPGRLPLRDCGMPIERIARWCNGSTRPFGGQSLGSNPSRATIAPEKGPRKLNHGKPHQDF